MCKVIEINSMREKCVYVEFQGISHAYISKFPNVIDRSMFPYQNDTYFRHVGEHVYY